MTCGGSKLSGGFSVFPLTLWLVVCSQGPILAQSDKGGAPTQASPVSHAVVTALMPQPRSIDYGDGSLRVTGGFQVEWLGYRHPVLDRAVSRFQNDVAQRTGLDVARMNGPPLRIDCRGEDKSYLTIDARERYSLAVKGNAVVLTAAGPAGVVRGLATLRQSITNMPGGFAIPAMTIGPKFASSCRMRRIAECGSFRSSMFRDIR